MAMIDRQLSAGLPDDAFLTDGLLTKRVVRAYALAVLAPRPGELLWDLGAGTGSIGLEWCRLHPTNSAIAVERDAERAARIGVNAAAFEVEGQLRVIVGDLSSAIEGLPRPSAVFFGGGIDDQLLQHCWELLDRGGRLAAHSVTAESDAALLAGFTRWGGDLTRVAVEAAEPIGRFTGFKPARTVTAWSAIKR